ncbi:PIN domain-containing protein [Allosaccharopolyspora coralli]|uniref:PIN domain-containing protein n=1 Tax=Allosaccharopolyspora coralli TaxID=2665642 RepID=A0A5Q3QCB6_9PSEU|nr:PIN domain-containing protein [Allosaccharopolyspora coralli]QGK68447.1 PIN domain-containing protein [Allosaccharopolyspora coralli]
MNRHPVSLLDTSAVIDFPAEAADRHAAEHAISSITLAELSFGVHCTNVVESARRQERLVEIRSTLDVIPFDSPCAQTYGALRALVLRLRRDPRPRRMDLMIAAVAGVHQLPLLTRNPKDFTALESVVDVIAV